VALCINSGAELPVVTYDIITKYMVLDNTKVSPFVSLSLQKRVEICVVFLKVGEIDTIKEQFTADVLVKAKWREPSLDKSAKDVKAAREVGLHFVDKDTYTRECAI
jgi:hypothetical protein